MSNSEEHKMSMRIVDLVRLEESPSGTFGALRIDGAAFCVTLEPPDLGNQRNVSNIPPGDYTCKRVNSPRFGDTFEITKVPGRSHVLFHAGNTVDHTQGCVLLGQYWGKLRGDRAVLNSGATFKEFMAAMGQETFFWLRIMEPDGLGLLDYGRGMESQR